MGWLFQMCGFLTFAYDLDTIQVMNHDMATNELLEMMMQKELNLWGGMIKGMGGSLKGYISDFTIVQWQWKDRKASYTPMDN